MTPEEELAIRKEALEMAIMQADKLYKSDECDGSVFFADNIVDDADIYLAFLFKREASQ